MLGEGLLYQVERNRARLELKFARRLALQYIGAIAVGLSVAAYFLFYA